MIAVRESTVTFAATDQYVLVPASALTRSPYVLEAPQSRVIYPEQTPVPQAPRQKPPKKKRKHRFVRAVLAVIRGIYRVHWLVYSKLWGAGQWWRVVAIVVALAEVATLRAIVAENQITAREEILCNDAAHQVVQVGSSNRLLDPVKSINQDSRIAKQLTRDRGYTVSAARVAQANPGLFDDHSQALGPTCISVPGPIPFGFAEADGDTSIGEYQNHFLLNTSEFRKLNPGLRGYEADWAPDAGTVIKVRRDYDTSVALTTAKMPLADMTHGRWRYVQGDRLAKLNSTAFVHGEGPEKAGDPAYLPIEQTRFERQNGIEISDVITAYDDNYESLPATQAIEPRKRAAHKATSAPARFARTMVSEVGKQARAWPKGQTDNWHGVENSNPYLKRYVNAKLGYQQSWCGWFVRYVLNRAGAGLKVREHLAGQSYYIPRVRDLYGWMVNDLNRHYYVYGRDVLDKGKASIKPGDVIFFNYYGSKAKFLASHGNHVGIVVGVHGNQLRVGDGNYHKTDKVSVRTVSSTSPQIIAVSRRVNLGPITHGVKIPKLRDLSHEQSVRATDALEARGPEWHNRARTIRYLMDNANMEDYQAIALIGGFQTESASVELEPAREQFGGGPGIGLAQWEGGRKERLLAFAEARGKSWTDLDVQLEFVNEELNGSEKSAAEWIRGTTGLVGAADAALNGYERPANRYVTPRLEHAARLIEAYYDAAR